MQHHQKNTTQTEKLSQDLLLAVKTEQVYASFQNQLAGLSPEILAEELRSDAQKIAFWVNIYNAYIQIILKEKPALAHDKATLFAKPQFEIAGKSLSFDNVEHGILRRSKIKYGLGYIPNYWISSFERKHRVSRLDTRIHFALNCGAKSCPPIAFYNTTQLDAQLDMAAHNYLAQHVVYDSTKNTVGVTKLVFWFRGDFRGKYHILSLLKKYQIIPQEANPKIKYLEYDWEIKLDYYLEQ